MISKSGGKESRSRFLANSLTDKTSTNNVERLSLCKGRVFKTCSVEIIEVQRSITSGCCSHKSWGFKKKETPSFLATWE